MRATPRTALVTAGYDAVADTCEAWKAHITDDPRDEWCDELVCRQTYFAGFDPGTNRRLLVEAGFEPLRDELVTIREPEGGATFHWVLAVR